MALMSQAPARWTEPDLHDFPQDGQRYEIVDGCLHVTPPQPRRHDDLARAIVATLRAAAPSGWWACDRIGIAAGQSNLVPDVTVLRPRSSGATWCDPADVALVVEVESESTRRRDRVFKPALYAEAGIENLWLVDPETDPAGPVLHVYALGEHGYRHVRSVKGAESCELDAPYRVRVGAATLGGRGDVLGARLQGTHDTVTALRDQTPQ